MVGGQIYRATTHTGGGGGEFLDLEQERHRPQLEGYAKIMSKMEERPIRLGLYFPLPGGREWSYLLDEVCCTELTAEKLLRAFCGHQ